MLGRPLQETAPYRSLRLAGAFCRAARVITGIARLQLPAFGVEDPKICQTSFLQRKLQGRPDHAQTVCHAPAEIDGRGLLEIFGGTGYLTNTEAKVYALRKHLIVEDKVIRVFQKRKLQQNAATEGSIAAVVFRQLDSQKQIFECRKEAVGYIFVEWHTSVQRLSTDNAGTEHDVIDLVSHHTGHRRHQKRRVLIVGMHHNHHVGARSQSLAIARLLVASVAIILVMDEELQSQALGDFDGAV